MPKESELATRGRVLNLYSIDSIESILYSYK